GRAVGVPGSPLAVQPLGDAAQPGNRRHGHGEEQEIEGDRVSAEMVGEGRCEYEGDRGQSIDPGRFVGRRRSPAWFVTLAPLNDEEYECRMFPSPGSATPPSASTDRTESGSTSIPGSTTRKPPTASRSPSALTSSPSRTGTTTTWAALSRSRSDSHPRSSHWWS